MSALATVTELRAKAVLDPARVATKFSIAAQDEVSVDRDAFIDALTTSGSRHVHMVPDATSPTTSLVRAISNDKKGKRDDGSSLMWRRLKSDGTGSIAFALIVAHPGVDEWDGDHIAKVFVAKDGTGGVQVVGSPKLRPNGLIERDEIDAVAAVQRRYRHERAMLTHADVATFRNRVFEDIGAQRVGTLSVFIALASSTRRDANGNRVTFSPDEDAMRIGPALALASTDLLPAELYDHNAPRYGGPVRRDIVDEIAELRAEIDETLADMKAGGKPQLMTVAARLARVEETRARAITYASVLKFAHEDIDAALAAARALADHTLHGVSGGLLGNEMKD